MEAKAKKEMPEYVCHKRVKALKIASIEGLENGALRITPVEDGYAPFEVESKYIPLHDPARPQIGWYFVVYDNGYKSFSPADAFENGYTRI